MTKPVLFDHFKSCIEWWGGARREGRKETDLAWHVTADDVKARGFNLDFKNPNTVADQHDDPVSLLERLDDAEVKTASLRDQLKGMLAEALLQ